MTVIERECPDCEGSGVVYVDDGEGGMDSERCDVCAGDGQVVPASDHRGAVALVEQARYCVTAALNCSAHPWHGSDEARRWLIEASALRDRT